MASLHQAIADLLPSRLEFYEAWLNPVGLREGRIGLAPLAAVLSFLRQEGDAYQLMVAERAGEYAAEWTVADLSTLPPLCHSRHADARCACASSCAWRVTMIRSTYGGSRGIVRWRKERGAIDIRGSLFCEVRDPVEQPLCEYYRSAIRRVMRLFDVDVDIETEQCRATGAGQCLMVVLIRPIGATE